jgi:hypothetical protein
METELSELLDMESGAVNDGLEAAFVPLQVLQREEGPLSRLRAKRDQLSEGASWLGRDRYLKAITLAEKRVMVVIGQNILRFGNNWIWLWALLATR